MPQGMVQLEDGSWVPLGDAPGPTGVPQQEPQPQPQSQPQPQQPNRLDPRTFVQQEFRDQFNAIQRTTNIQRRLINKQRSAMGNEKYLVVAQKLEADFKKQAEGLFQSSQQKIGLMDAVESLISQGALDEEQTAKAQNLLHRTAMGNDLGNLISPIPEKDKKADPLAQYNALQSLQGRMQTDANRFSMESNTSSRFGFDPGVKTTLMFETRGAGSNKEDVEVFRSVYDTKLRSYRELKGTDYLRRHNIRQSALQKVSKAISDFEATGRLTAPQETLLATWAKRGNNGATVGEHVKGSAVVDSSRKNRAAAQSRMTAINPATNERIVSLDGGVTWQPEN